MKRLTLLLLGLALGVSATAGAQGLTMQMSNGWSFQRQNILNDQTLFGVGAVGDVQGGGTTLGRIGYGYVYPNFNAQLTYSSSAKNPAQISIGLFQPSVMLNGYTQTKIPRVEAEVTWKQTSGKNKYMLWAGGEWQSVSHFTQDSTVSAVGGTAGVRLDMQELSVVVSGYIGSGIGTALAFFGDELANGRNKRKSDGGYAQVGYTFNKKTTVAGSWGFSRLKGAGTTSADGTDGPIGQVSLYTVGIYHQWTKSLKLVFEGSREINRHADSQALLSGLPDRTNISGGFMLFY